MGGPRVLSRLSCATWGWLMATATEVIVGWASRVGSMTSTNRDTHWSDCVREQ